MDKETTRLQQWQIHQNSNFRMPGELGGSTGSWKEKMHAVGKKGEGREICVYFN